MSVEIKGMQMPKSCLDCPLEYFYDVLNCGIEDLEVFEYTEERHPDCPLVEIRESVFCPVCDVRHDDESIDYCLECGAKIEREGKDE